MQRSRRTKNSNINRIFSTKIFNRLKCKISRIFFFVRGVKEQRKTFKKEKFAFFLFAQHFCLAVESGLRKRQEKEASVNKCNNNFNTILVVFVFCLSCLQLAAFSLALEQCFDFFFVAFFSFFGSYSSSMHFIYFYLSPWHSYHSKQWQ